MTVNVAHFMFRLTKEEWDCLRSQIVTTYKLPQPVGDFLGSLSKASRRRPLLLRMENGGHCPPN